jgi:hypothetical protein
MLLELVEDLELRESFHKIIHLYFTNAKVIEDKGSVTNTGELGR